MILKICAATILSAVLLSVQGASSHSFYSQACCDDRDCAPISDVRWTAAGWFVAATGETIATGDARIKASPDVQFHACIPSYQKRVRCLYVPGPGI
jgi:hypothetical protein